MRSRDDVLLIVLAVTTGATDALAFERLGNAFASVITGNLVLLAVSAARGDGRMALLAGCALAGYGLGVCAAASITGAHDEPADPPGWTIRMRAALMADLLVLVGVAVGWQLAGGHPGRGAQLLLLACAAGAMGMQSTAVRRLGPVSTTYLTSTFIGALEALTRRRWSRDETRGAAILAAALVGAAASTGLILHAWRLVTIVQLGPLIAVLAVSTVMSKRH